MSSMVILVYPWGDPFLESRGVEKRSSMLISSFKKSGKNLVILAPIEILRESVYSKKFFSYRGHGGLLIDLNPSYYYALLTLIKNCEKNVKVKIVLTGPLGFFGAFLAKLLFQKRKEVSIIYDAHNVEKDRIAQKSIAISGLSAPFLITKIIFLVSEFFATKIVDMIFSVSWEDKNKFVQIYKIPPEKIKVVPSSIGSEFSYYLPKSLYRRRERGRPWCVFHGTYDYLPNKEAIDIIVHEIAPKIPEACFLIAGKGVPRDLGTMPRNVYLVGFVKDLDKFLASCDIAVVPLKRGAGTKLKMYDYMRNGIAIITTPKGAEGLGIIPGKHAIVANDIGERFIKGLKYLIYNPKLRRKLGHNARKLLNRVTAKW